MSEPTTEELLAEFEEIQKSAFFPPQAAMPQEQQPPPGPPPGAQPPAGAQPAPPEGPPPGAQLGPPPGGPPPPQEDSGLEGLLAAFADRMDQLAEQNKLLATRQATYDQTIGEMKGRLETLTKILSKP